MAFYDYSCHACGHKFERRFSIEDRKIPENEACPSCGVIDSVKIQIAAKFERMAPDQLGRVRPHSDWIDHLNNIKRNNPGSDFTTW